MKKYIIILFAFISSFTYSQDYEQLCLDCAEQNGFYCGDDPANWTQYSPNGCVPNGEGGLFYLNDGWEDCVDASDENGAVPTTVANCSVYAEPCDTIFVNTIEYETIFDTIYNTTIEYDTIVQIEYIQQTDTIIEIQYEQITEYIDCDSGLPCDINGMQEVLDKSKETGLIYNLQGKILKRPNGVFIENGKIKYLIK